MVKATDKTKPVAFSGDRSDDSLRRFVRENRTAKKRLENVAVAPMLDSANNELRQFFATPGIKDEL